MKWIYLNIDLMITCDSSMGKSADLHHIDPCWCKNQNAVLPKVLSLDVLSVWTWSKLHQFKIYQ